MINHVRMLENPKGRGRLVVVVDVVRDLGIADLIPLRGFDLLAR